MCVEDISTAYWNSSTFAGTQLWIQTGNVIFQVDIEGTSIQMQYSKWTFAWCAIPSMLFPWPVICTVAHKCISMSSPKWFEVWHVCALAGGEVPETPFGICTPDSSLQHSRTGLCLAGSFSHSPHSSKCVFCSLGEQTHMSATYSFPASVWCTCVIILVAKQLSSLQCSSVCWAAELPSFGLALMFGWGQWTVVENIAQTKCWNNKKHRYQGWLWFSCFPAAAVTLNI